LQLRGDPRHRWISPGLYKREDAEACWRSVTAPVLLVLGEESEYLARLGDDGTESALRRALPGIETARVAGVGHMLHLERPDLVAPLIEQFLSAH
jgi:pimeloyl-ACP methyl ester carboxylesterase